MDTTNEPATSVTIALGIPGRWSNPGELLDRLPEDCRLNGEALLLPDGTSIDFVAVAADKQFAAIFRSSCRQPATEEQLWLRVSGKVRGGAA